MSRPLAVIFVLIFALVAMGTAQSGNFTGFYVGVNLGGASGTSDAKTTTIFSPTGYFAMTSPGAIAIAGRQQLTPTSFTGGGQAGFNFQISHIVLGAEADFGHMQLSQSMQKSGTYPCCAPTGFTVTQSVRTDWLFTARPRLGVAFGPVMFYGTGGLAVTDFNYKARFDDTFATATENGGVNENRTGWIAGGGAEFRITHRWSVKGEFLRADFGGVRNTSTNLMAFSPPIAYPTNVWTHRANLTTNIGRVGINFHF
ncbi:MAG TPA: outer membrane beta-barrel protein [Terriglobales bacterium]|jgi:outer membrane immunogenic protein|nr:outer membrane beta-barrel protein [Terriglobales bacterium]